MLSVPECYRPLALALTSVCVHIFGDVPSPVITGTSHVSKSRCRMTDSNILLPLTHPLLPLTHPLIPL